MKLEAFDDKKIYCRRLGHELSFHYCRQEDIGNPCFRIKDCWGQNFSLEDWLREHYPGFEIKGQKEGDLTKIQTIFDLAKKAQALQKNTEDH